MNQAKQLFAEGKLNEAIDVLLKEVKAAPNDMTRRTFLFELSAFVGDWTRAERQLDVIGHQSAQAELGVTIYRAILKAEQERQRLFDEGIPPHFLTEPPTYVDLNIQAINQLKDGALEDAKATLDRTEEERPAISGRLNDQGFDDFRDYDDLVAPILEVFVKDKYVWMPFEQIKRLEISAPRQLRDLLWPSARIEALDGTVGEVYIPALYSGTPRHSNDQVRLGRLTDWSELTPGLSQSFGMRLFIVGGDEKSLFEVSRVEFQATAEKARSA